MSLSESSSWVELALLHLDFVDDRCGLAEAKAHAHFARMFLQREQQARLNARDGGGPLASFITFEPPPRAPAAAPPPPLHRKADVGRPRLRVLR